MTAASLGAALLTSGQSTSAIMASGLTVAAGVIGNLVANSIQKDQDQMSVSRVVSGVNSLHVRSGEIIQEILDGDEAYGGMRARDIGAVVKQYWLGLPPNVRDNFQTIGILSIEHFVSQLLDPTEQTVLLESWLEVLTEACKTDASLAVDLLHLHRLAGALTREFPKRLLKAFSEDLEREEGFAEMTLRLLVRSVELSKTGNFESSKHAAALERLEALIENVAKLSKNVEGKLNGANSDLVLQLTTISKVMEINFAKLATGQDQLKVMIDELLNNFNTSSSRDYPSALSLVAAKHELTTSQLKTVLSEYAEGIRENVSGFKHTIEASIAAGKFLDAEMHAIRWSQQIDSSQQSLGGDDAMPKRTKSEALRYAGLAALMNGDVGRSEKHYQHALELQDPMHDFNGWADSQEGVVGCLLAFGKIDRALPVVLQILQVVQNTRPFAPQRAFWCNYTLGILLHQGGNFTEAEPFLVRAFLIANEHFNRNDPNFAVSVYSLASFCLDANNLPKAEELSRSYLQLLQETNQSDSAYAVAATYILARVLRALGGFDEAKTYQLNSLSLAGKYLSSSHPQRALSLNELGLIYHNQTHYENAEQSFILAIDHEEENNRADSVLIANFAANLGRLYLSMDRWAEAEKSLDRAYAIRNLKLGGSHMKTLEVLSLRDRAKSKRDENAER